MVQHNSSRRTVLRTAAWAAPAVSVAVAAPSFAASGNTYQTVTKSFTYDVQSGPAVGNLGIWTIDVTATIPLSIASGSTITPPTINAKVTTSQLASDRLRSQNIQWVDTNPAGSGITANYTINGSSPTAGTATIHLPQTSVPPAPQLLIANASGVGDAHTAGGAGTYTITLGTMSGQLRTNTALVVNLVSMTPSPTTQDMTLGTYTIF